MGAGDEEEHAILLHNYLLYLSSKSDHGGNGSVGVNGTGGIEIYVVLGKAIPEGNNAVYVLLR